MADVKWIKIVVDIFDDEKILLIESLPAADSIITIWFKLLTLAGKQNNNGVFLLNDKIAYTDEMLATIFRRDISTVRLALETFQQFGMIEIIDGVITIPKWGKHQNLDQIESKNEYMRNYMREYRKKQVEKIDQIDCKTNSKVNSKTNSKANVSSLEEERDKELDKEKEKDILSFTNVNDCQTETVRRVVDEWNKLSELGIKTVNKISASSERYKMLNARIKQNGEKDVVKAINNIRNSSFLQGKVNSFTITFDWFVKPNNFNKVADGNYDDNKNINTDRKTQFATKSNLDKLEEW